jgi:hypothetical protein
MAVEELRGVDDKNGYRFVDVALSKLTNEHLLGGKEDALVQKFAPVFRVESRVSEIAHEIMRTQRLLIAQYELADKDLSGAIGPDLSKSFVVRQTFEFADRLCAEKTVLPNKRPRRCVSHVKDDGMAPDELTFLHRSTAELFEVLFDFECGHAAGAGGGDGLAVAAILDVSAGVDAVELNARAGDEDVVLGLDVAVVVEVELAFEHLRVGLVADAEEHEADGKRPALLGLLVVELEAVDVLLIDAEDLLDDGVVEELDLRMSDGALEHDAGGAEVFAAVDDVDLGGEAGEEESFFHGGVAAADDRDLFAAGEEAVAGGAGADAVADECLLGRKAEPARGGAGGDDERAGVDDLTVDGELEGCLADVGGGEMAEGDLGAEARGLLLHVVDEFGALDAVGPAGEVFDEGGDGELAARLVAFEDERLEVGARGVDGSGQPGAAGAEDDGVADGVVLRHSYLIVEGAGWVQSVEDGRNLAGAGRSGRSIEGWLIWFWCMG